MQNPTRTHHRKPTPPFVLTVCKPVVIRIIGWIEFPEINLPILQKSFGTVRSHSKKYSHLGKKNFKIESWCCLQLKTLLDWSVSKTSEISWRTDCLFQTKERAGKSKTLRPLQENDARRIYIEWIWSGLPAFFNANFETCCKNKTKNWDLRSGLQGEQCITPSGKLRYCFCTWKCHALGTWQMKLSPLYFRNKAILNCATLKLISYLDEFSCTQASEAVGSPCNLPALMQVEKQTLCYFKGQWFNWK